MENKFNITVSNKRKKRSLTDSLECRNLPAGEMEYVLVDLVQSPDSQEPVQVNSNIKNNNNNNVNNVADTKRRRYTVVDMLSR